MRIVIAWVVAALILHLLSVAATSTLSLAEMGRGGDVMLLADVTLGMAWVLIEYGLFLAGCFAVALALAALIRWLAGGALWPYALAAGAVAATGSAYLMAVYFEVPALIGGSGFAAVGLQAIAGAFAGLVFALIAPRAAKAAV